MKNKIQIILFSALVVFFCFSQAIAQQDYSGPSCTKDSVSQSSSVFNAPDGENSNHSQLLLAKRGCCSWHGGVCGCQGGRVVCCDRTFSPTCTCNHDGPLIHTD